MELGTLRSKFYRDFHRNAISYFNQNEKFSSNEAHSFVVINVKNKMVNCLINGTRN